jgi:hypothetical protein
MLSANCQVLILSLIDPRLLRRRLLSRLFRARRQDRVQRIAFLPRPEFHNAAVANVFNQALQNLSAQSGARHFASAEKDRGLYLVAFIQKTQHVVLLGVVVVIVHVDAELHFLDRDRLLVLFGLAVFFLLLIEKLPIIHDAANRRLRSGGNLYQIQVLFAGQFERLKRLQNSNLLTFVANHANFACADTFIGADKTLIDTNLRWLSNGVG